MKSWHAHLGTQIREAPVLGPDAPPEAKRIVHSEQRPVHPQTDRTQTTERHGSATEQFSHKSKPH